MKRIWTALLALCLLLPCAAHALEARDATGVNENDGRLRGDIVGTNAENGEAALALRVDCPVPPDVTPAQRASDAALAFVASCGLGDGHVISALRPEDEARLYALNEAPEAREAFVARTLAEWFTPRLDYTWVQVAFTLRGLPVAPCYWPGADGVSRACVANLYLGDGGELRDFTLSYAPCEVSAVPYTGALKTPLEALGELARQFACVQPSPREDERGRALPAHWPVALDIRPAYHTADGVTFFPAWLIAVAWQESDGQTGMPWRAACWHGRRVGLAGPFPGAPSRAGAVSRRTRLGASAQEQPKEAA